MHHPEVGDLELNFEVLTPPDELGYRILMYTADPGTPAAEALQLLASSGTGVASEENRHAAAS